MKESFVVTENGDTYRLHTLETDEPIVIREGGVMEHDPMCPIPESYVTIGTPPEPHNCPFCKISLPARADERERATERVAAAYRLAWETSQDAPAQSEAVAAARGGDRGTGGVSVPRCGVCKRELVWMGVELDGNTTRLHHRDDLSLLCAAGGS